MAPPPDFSISGISCFMHRKTPRRSDSVPLFLVVVCGRCRLSRLNPHVVEGGIEPAEDLHGLVQGRLHLFTAPHIAPDRESAAAVFLDQACRLLIALVGYIGDDHARALPGERQRSRPTDAARPAGDECDLTFEEISIDHFSIPSRS